MTTATTVNEKLLSLMIGHLVDLQHHNNLIVADISRILRAADAETLARLAAALTQLSDAGRVTLAQWTHAIYAVRGTIDAGYVDAETKLTTDLRALSEYELEWNEKAMKVATPTQVDLRLDKPAPEAVFAASTAKPFQGQLLSAWFDDLSAAKQKRISTRIAIGFTNGETVSEMIRALRGTKAAGYSDGLLAIDTRNAEAVVRTAAGHFASEARNAFFSANSDIISEEQWVSTLDNRTTEECQIRDGLLYTVEEHKPVGHRVPWSGGPGRIHWNCRSTSCPVVKSASALGIELPPLERAAMNGTVPAGTTYAEWLAAQPASRQDEILGPTRGALMRKGELSFDRFFNAKGAFLTLDELRARDNAAFARAGL